MKKALILTLAIVLLLTIIGVAIYFFNQGSLSNLTNDYQIYLSNQTEYSTNMTNEAVCSFVLQSVGNQSTYCYNVQRDIPQVLNDNCQKVIPNLWKCVLNYKSQSTTFDYLSKSGGSYYIKIK